MSEPLPYLAALLLALPWSAPAASAQCTAPDTVMRFDMGTSSSPVASAQGFVQVRISTMYPATYTPPSGFPAPASPSNFGWLTSTGAGISRPVPPTPNVHNHPPELLQDSIAFGPTAGAVSTGTFRLKRPAGDYVVVAYLGDVGDVTTDPNAPVKTPLEGMDISINMSGSTPPIGTWTKVIDDSFARLQAPWSRASFTEAWGGYKRVTLQVTIGASQTVNLRFDSAVGGQISVMGLEVYQMKSPCTYPPIRYDHTQHALVSDINDALLQQGLAAFNADDFAGARDKFDDVSGSTQLSIARAWGYAWLLGWLTDAEEQVDFGLLDQTQAILSDPSMDKNNWAVTGLLADLADLERGATFLKHSGYSTDAYPTDNLGTIGMNLKAGLQLCEQMDGDLLTGADNPRLPESPLCAKAQYLAARSMYTRNTRVMQGGTVADPDEGSVAYNYYFVGILQNKLWPRLDPTVSTRPFKNAHEATLLAFRMLPPSLGGSCPAGISATDGPGPLIAWTEGVPPGMDFTNVWWKNEVAYSGPSTAPLWVQEQHRYAAMFRNVGKWWMSRRLYQGELGGGGGDDTEGAAILGVPLVARTEGAGNQPEDGITEVMRKVLFGAEVSQQECYFYGLPDAPKHYTDPEHGGEYTTYPLFWLTASAQGNPRYLDFGMRSMRNLDDGSMHLVPAGCADQPWSGLVSWAPSGENFRHCKRSMLGACEIDPDANADQDVLETMKVLAAGFDVLDHTPNPRLVQLWKEYGLAWQDAARATHQKPGGIFPSAVDFSSGVHGLDSDDPGTTPEWYHADITANAAEMYELMLQMYRVDHDTRFLEPIDAAIAFIYGYIGNEPPLDSVLGTQGWTYHTMKNIVATAAFRALDDLPLVGGSSQTMIDAVIANHANESTKLVLASRNNNGASTNKDALAEIFRVDARWLEFYWPFATSLVSSPDRLFVFPPLKPAQIAMQALYESQTGSPFVIAPTHPVAWYDTISGSENDFAILVNHVEAEADATGGTATPPPAASLAFRALLWNHAASARDVTLRICRDLPFGTYRLRRGLDANFNDQIDGTPTTDTNVVLDRNFQDLTLAAVPAGGIHVVELYLVDAPAVTPCTTDVGIGPDDVSLSSGQVRVHVHNLGGVLASGWNVRVSMGSTFVDTAVPSLSATSTLTPAAGQVVSTGFTANVGDTVTVELLPPSGACQITTTNDKVTKTL